MSDDVESALALAMRLRASGLALNFDPVEAIEARDRLIAASAAKEAAKRVAELEAIVRELADYLPGERIPASLIAKAERAVPDESR